MAYPANIAPNTPGTNYDVQSCGDGSVDLYIFQKGLPYITAKKPKSRCRIDIPLYDLSTTRDEVWAPEMGRGGVSVLTNTGIGTVTPFSGDVAIAGNSTTIMADEVLTMMQQSDSFTHVPPHQNVLALSYIRWYDGPVTANQPTGNLVAECSVDLYRGQSSSIPQFLGSAPPTA